MTWDRIQETTKVKGDLSVVGLDLANTYVSVFHALPLNAMEHFWIPEHINQIMKRYHDSFQMRFTTGDFTTNLTQAKNSYCCKLHHFCDLVCLVMEMLLLSTECSEYTVEVQSSKKAFMGDIAHLTKDEEKSKRVSELVDELITWSRIRFKVEKSRSVTFKKGRQKETKFSILL